MVPETCACPARARQKIERPGGQQGSLLFVLPELKLRPTRTRVSGLQHPGLRHTTPGSPAYNDPGLGPTTTRDSGLQRPGTPASNERDLPPPPTRGCRPDLQVRQEETRLPLASSFPDPL